MTDMRDFRGRFAPQSRTNRFWSKVDVRGADECWPWIAGKWNCKMSIPYGSFRGFDGKMTHAHRVAYELHHQASCKGQVVRHKCDNPLCCNPHHLQLGTTVDNIRDMVTRKRHAYGERNGKTKLTEEDVRFIRRRIGEGAQLKGLAKIFNVHPTTIDGIKSGRRWIHLS